MERVHLAYMIGALMLAADAGLIFTFATSLHVTPHRAYRRRRGKEQ